MNWIRYSVGSKHFPQSMGAPVVLVSSVVAIPIPVQIQPIPKAPGGGGGSYVPLFIQPKAPAKRFEAGARLTARTRALGWPVITQVVGSTASALVHSREVARPVAIWMSLAGAPAPRVSSEVGHISAKAVVYEYHLAEARLTAREMSDESEELWLLGIQDLKDGI